MPCKTDWAIPADHAAAAGDKPGQHAIGPFLYASGSRPLAGYTIKRGVGSGGFGEVYYAISDAGKEVALKLIRRNLDTELRGMRQCLNLKHPNLSSLYDIRQDDSGGAWVVMEYMSGECLETELADHPQGLPLPEALAWFHGIAAGVAYLHDHGIVHRDLKPGNIFRDEGVVKVGDYGLSKFISCSRRSGHTESIGTVHYMAPEVAHGRYGKELDIYALGAILYELLTGHVPFEGESVGEVLMKHLTAQVDVRSLPSPIAAWSLGPWRKTPLGDLRPSAKWRRRCAGGARPRTSSKGRYSQAPTSPQAQGPAARRHSASQRSSGGGNRERRIRRPRTRRALHRPTVAEAQAGVAVGPLALVAGTDRNHLLHPLLLDRRDRRSAGDDLVDRLRRIPHRTLHLPAYLRPAPIARPVAAPDGDAPGLRGRPLPAIRRRLCG